MLLHPFRPVYALGVTHPSVIPPAGRALELAEVDALKAAMADIVDHSHLFKSLDDEGRKQVLESGFVRSFADGMTILEQGHEPGDDPEMYLVLDGKVRVETQTAGGKVHLAELGRGACIGEVSVLTGGPRTATVTAVGEVDVAAFAKHRVDRALERYPKVKELLESVVESRARDTISKILAD
jgi:CRP-like cAMP-binding protein